MINAVCEYYLRDTKKHQSLIKNDKVRSMTYFDKGQVNNIENVVVLHINEAEIMLEPHEGEIIRIKITDILFWELENGTL